MPTGKEILKGLVLRTCSPGVQKELRRWYVVRDVLRASKHEEPEAALLPSLIRSGDSVADIGANVGYYTRQLASLVGRDGRVYSFEPLAENFEILETVVRKGHLENVRCFRTALGLQPGIRKLVIPTMKPLRELIGLILLIQAIRGGASLRRLFRWTHSGNSG